jgi:hypothetical protein
VNGSNGTRSFRVLRAGGVSVALVAGYSGLRPAMRTWGASPAEVTVPLPGDGLVPFPRYRSTHAVGIAASSSDIWPWLAQLGQGRAGLYSYDWLENLLGCSIHSVHSVVPQWQHLAVGDEIRLTPPGHPVALAFRVALVEPPHHLLLVTPGTAEQASAAGLPFMSWSFAVEDHLHGYCRLVVRMRSDFRGTLSATVADKYLFEPVHWMMERKMLLGIRQRAEQRADQRRRRQAGRQSETFGFTGPARSFVPEVADLRKLDRVEADHA